MADAFGLADRPGVFIRGNHEIRNAYSSGQTSLVDRNDELTYGAFNWGDTRFVTLDCGEDKPDTTWVYIPVWGNTDSYQPCTQLWAPLLSKAPFDINITAHVHEYNRIDPKRGENPFPVIVGGGYDLDGATVTVLRRRGDSMSVTVLGADGRTIDAFQL